MRCMSTGSLSIKDVSNPQEAFQLAERKEGFVKEQLEKAEKELESLEEYLGESEELNESVLKAETQQELPDELREQLEIEEEDIEELRRAYKDVESAHQEFLDVVNKIRENDLLILMMGFAEEFDSEPSERALEVIEAALQEAGHLENATAKTKINNAADQAYEPRSELEDVRDKLSEAGGLIDDVAMDLRRHLEFIKRNASSEETKSIAKAMYREAGDLNAARTQVEALMEGQEDDMTGPLSFIHQDLLWVNKSANYFR